MTHVSRVLVDFDLRRPTDAQKMVDFDGVESDQAGMTVHAQKRQAPRSEQEPSMGRWFFILWIHLRIE